MAITATPEHCDRTTEEAAIATPSDDVVPIASVGLSRPTSAQQVADHIRRMIFERRLVAGERVPQDEIAAELHVSRVPVREAVIALAGEGWVTTEPHRGAFVNGLDENTTLDHYALIGMLFGFGARRAAERGSDEQLVRLVEIDRQIQRVDSPQEIWDLNDGYLRQMMHMAASRRLVTMARVMWSSIVPGNYFAEVPGVIPLHKRGLRSVTKALRERDADTAEREFAAMLRGESLKVVDLLASRGLFSQ